MDVWRLSDAVRRNLGIPGDDLLTYDEMEQALAPHGFTFCPTSEAPPFIEDWLRQGHVKQWVALIYRKPRPSAELIQALWFIGLSYDAASAKNAEAGAMEAVYQAVLAVISRFPTLFLAPNNC